MGLLFSKLSNLFNQFSTDKPLNVVTLGLDNAGKTTLMYKLKLNETLTSIPTIGFNVETISPKKGLTFTMWDVGGQDRIRGLWSYYFQSAQGLVYVVDSSDELRFPEAKNELYKILEADEMRQVPVVVLANKQDLPNAASCSKIAEVLGLHTLRDRRWHIQATCAHNGEGIYEAMDRLAELTKEYIRNQP